MALIQDLRDRKLTGCRGCDAVRKGLYRGMDLWKPPGIQVASTHDSFNASTLGAFIQSPVLARGGGEVSPIEAELTATSIIWREKGDTQSEFGSIGGTDYKAIAYNGATQVAVCPDYGGDFFTSSTTYTAAFPNGTLQTPDGQTRHTFDVGGSGSAPSDPLVGFDGIDIIRVSDNEVVRKFRGFQTFQLIESGASRSSVATLPFCFLGEFENATNCIDTGENQKITVRWRKELISGTDWRIVLTVGAIRAYLSVGEACRLTLTPATFVFTDTDGADHNVVFSMTSNVSSATVNHVLCGGGTWPTTETGIDWHRGYTLSSPPTTSTWEPATLKDITTWSMTGINVVPYTLPEFS